MYTQVIINEQFADINDIIIEPLLNFSDVIMFEKSIKISEYDYRFKEIC